MYINVHTRDAYLQTCFMRIKNKQSIFWSCVIFYVSNQPRLEVTANTNITVVTHNNASFSIPNNTTVLNSNSNIADSNNTIITSSGKTPTPSAINATDFPMSITINNSEALNVHDLVLSLKYTTPKLEVEILVEGTDSMRLKNSDPETIENSVLQWYTYCEEYVLGAFQKAGHNRSPLVLSFDWVNIDDTRLDVFFVGVYIITPQVDTPDCRCSFETLQNYTNKDDACSRMTLGDFGQHLISGSKPMLTVKTMQTIDITSTLVTHVHAIDSINISRLSVSASFVDIPQLVSLQDEGSRDSIFDNSIILRAASDECARGTYRLGPLTVAGDICGSTTGPGNVRDTFTLHTSLHQGHRVWEKYTSMGWRYIYYEPYYETWFIGPEPGKTNTAPRVISTSDIPPATGWLLSCAFGPFYAWGGTVTPNCFGCPQYSSTLNFEAQTILDCMCNPGYYTDSASQCFQCPSNTYNPGANRDACQDCPDLTVSDPGSHAITDCVCGPGVGLHSTNKCELCEAGTWKSESGSFPCTDCTAGKYSTVSGGNGIGTCKSCSQHSTSSGGSNVCNCEAGFIAQGLDANGGAICDVCPAGKYSMAKQGMTVCEPCVANSYSTTVGATSSWYCDWCPDATTSEAGSTICVCGDGFAMSADNECIVKICASGPRGDEGARCEPCPKGKYASETGTDCEECAAGKFREFESDEVECSSCPPGTYAPDPKTAKCETCNDGVVSDDRIKCIVIATPKILNGQTRIVFDHFKLATSVKSILQTASPLEWMNGDSLAIYENGTRGLNPTTLVFNDIWSPVNIDPIHYRDNVYIFTTNRTNEELNSVLMSLEWQINSNARLLSLTEYSQVIGMGLYYLRKHSGILTEQQIVDANTDHSHYEPFGVRIVNNVPSYTTIINYTLQNTF